MNEQASDTQDSETKRLRKETSFTWIEDADGKWQISSRGFLSGFLSQEAQQERRVPAILGGEATDVHRITTRSKTGKIYVRFLGTDAGSVAIDETGHVYGRLSHPEQALKAWESLTGCSLKEAGHGPD